MFPTPASGVVFALYMAMFVAQGMLGQLYHVRVYVYLPTNPLSPLKFLAAPLHC